MRASDASVMAVPGLDPGIDAAIHAAPEAQGLVVTRQVHKIATDSAEGPWMAGSRPAMTAFPCGRGSSPMTSPDFTLYGATFRSRLMLGTSQYPSPAILAEAARSSGAEIGRASCRERVYLCV